MVSTKKKLENQEPTKVWLLQKATSWKKSIPKVCLLANFFKYIPLLT